MSKCHIVKAVKFNDVVYAAIDDRDTHEDIIIRCIKSGRIRPDDRSACHAGILLDGIWLKLQTGTVTNVSIDQVPPVAGNP